MIKFVALVKALFLALLVMIFIIFNNLTPTDSILLIAVIIMCVVFWMMYLIIESIKEVYKK